MKAKRAEKLRLAAVSILAAALLVCMSFAFTFAFAEEGELSFPNAGFEDSGSEATSWTLGTYLNGKDPDKADIRFDIVSGDEAYEGNSLKISNASTEDIHALVTAAAIPVAPNTAYFIGFRVKSTAPSVTFSPCVRQYADVGGTVGVPVESENYHWLTDGSVYGQTDGWRYISVGFVSSSDAKSAAVFFEITPTGEGAVWLDDVEIGLMPESAFNGGMEAEEGRLPSGWTYSASEYLSADTQVYYEGESSLLVQMENYAAPLSMAAQARIPVQGGEEYRFSLRAMSREARYSQAYFTVTQYAADGSVTVAATESPSILLNEGKEWSDWREIWLGLKLNLNTAEAEIRIYVTAGKADVRFDAFTVRPRGYAFYEDFSDVSSSGSSALWQAGGDAKFTGEELVLGQGASAGAVWTELSGGCTYEISGSVRASSGAAPSLRIEYYSWRGEFVKAQERALSAGQAMQAFSVETEVPSATSARIVLENTGGGEAVFDDLSAVKTEDPRETQAGWHGYWISCGGEEAQHTGYRTRYFRKSFTVTKEVKSALLQYTGDDHIYGYLNGSASLGDCTFYSSVVADVTDRIVQGKNALAFSVTSGGDFCAVLFELTLVYEDGTVEHIFSDESALGFTSEVSGWKTAGFNDSAWLGSRFFGRVPCQPWGSIPYTYAVSSERVAILSEIRMPATAVAGETAEIALTFTLQHAIAADAQLRVFFVGEEGELPFSAKLVPSENADMTQWTPGQENTAVYMLEIPDFAAAGEYRLRFEEQGIVFDGTENNTPSAVIRIAAPRYELTRSEVKKEDGVTRMFIDGEKVNPMLYLRDFSTKFKAQYAEDMFGSGVTLLQFPNTRNYYMNGLSAVWTGNGTYDFDVFDDLIYETLEGAPDAKIMIALDADPPEWWLNENPGERAVNNAGGTYSNGVSYASQKWRQDAGEYYRAILEHALSQPYAGHIFAVKINAGATCEWQQYGMTLDTCGDYSQASLNAFRAWLTEKYGTDAALRTAWGDSSVTLATAAIPSREERLPSGYRTVLDGKKQRNVIDYHLFASDMVTDSILYLAGIVKEVTDGNWIVGTYNGYMINALTYEGNGIVNSSFSRLLESDLVDFYCSPILYDARMSGMSAGYMTMVDSILDAGKMFFLEVDERTVFYDDNGWQAPALLQEWGQTYTLRDTIEMLKRDFSNALAKGAGLWWYDMWGGWFDDPEIYDMISVMSEEMAYDLEHPGSSVSPIAWIQADDLLAYMPYDFDGTYDVLLQSHYNQKESLAKTGVPYDMYYLSDIAGGLKKQYDIYIIEATNIDADTRLDIELYLERDGATIIWSGLTGIYGSDGRISESAMEEVVGMDISFTSEGRYCVTIEDNGHYSTAGLDGFVYGNAASSGRVTPMAYVTDQSATVLGTLGNGMAGLAVKEIPIAEGESWTSVYSAVGNIPADFLRNILKHKGVNIYSEEGDVIFANSNYLAIDSPYGGARTISLGGRYDVYDVFSGETVATGVTSFDTVLEAGETRLYRLTASGTGGEDPGPQPPESEPEQPESPGCAGSALAAAGGASVALIAAAAVIIAAARRKNKNKKRS